MGGSDRPINNKEDFKMTISKKTTTKRAPKKAVSKVMTVDVFQPSPRGATNYMYHLPTDVERSAFTMAMLVALDLIKITNGLITSTKKTAVVAEVNAALGVTSVSKWLLKDGTVCTYGLNKLQDRINGKGGYKTDKGTVKAMLALLKKGGKDDKLMTKNANFNHKATYLKAA